MPELPDVEIFKKEASKALHQKIRAVEVFDDKIVTQSPKAVKGMLTDLSFTKLKRKGKYLFLYANQEIIVSLHFGMTGYIQYLPPYEKDPNYTAIQFTFDNQYKLDYISKRKLGKLEIVDNEQEYLRERAVGKDPFDYEQEEFASILKNKQSTIKSALMDQSVIAGIGNVYSDEILYQARVHPLKKVSELNDKQIVDIYYFTKSVLKTAIEREVDVSKLPDNYLLRHRKDKVKCPVCGGFIEKTKVAGRTSYYCENCQQYS